MCEIENVMILVGKNNTGKTAVIDAIRAATGNYIIEPEDFYDIGRPVEIEMSIEILEDDLKMFYDVGAVSKYRKFEMWKEDFEKKLPGFKENILTFTCFIDLSKKISYCDGIKKNNKYIIQILPKVYYVDCSRNIDEFQDDLLKFQGDASLADLKNGTCLFDKTKKCSHCFQCIGAINKKVPAELTAFETVRLLEYKLYTVDLERFANQVNKYIVKNGLNNEIIKYERHFDIDELTKVTAVVQDKRQEMSRNLDTLSAGTKSIYLLSLIEAYINEKDKVPSIIMIEDPEIYLHPQMQKTASEILYGLSKKNQVMFTTHSPNMIFNFSSKQIKQVVLDDEYHTVVIEQSNIDDILEDLGYTANDLMNVSFVFIVEGKQDSNRLPLLLEKYYSELYDDNGKLKRVSIIPTNSCTNIKTYANLKYINKLYLKDQFLMIRDSDGKNPKYLVKQLCSYYDQRAKEDVDNLPRVTPDNILILKYYSFENYFLDPKVMTEIGVIKSEDEFYNILFKKYKDYLYKLPSFKRMCKQNGIRINKKEDIIEHMELIRIHVRGHNLFDIFYGRYRNNGETEILKKYIDVAPRDNFAYILNAIDRFIYFENRRKQE